MSDMGARSSEYRRHALELRTFARISTRQSEMKTGSIIIRTWALSVNLPMVDKCTTALVQPF